MPSALEINCPGCEESLKIPRAVFGKKIKCKHCSHAFVVPNPDEATKGKGGKPAKPGAKTAAANPPPPPPPPAEAKKSLWDDDEGQDITFIEEEDVALCPHCAKPLDPPDARVCIHCGFNNLTRAKADIKRVWAPDAMDWFMHLLPGIVCLTICIALIVGNIICILNMRDWLTGTFLESDEKDASGRTKMYVPPGAFIFFVAFISMPVMVPCLKFAFKRLVKDYKPVERVRG